MNAPEQRKSTRVRVMDGHYASFPGGTAPIRDLGLDGVTLEDPEAMPFDSFVRLHLHLGTESIDCTGRVRQSDPDSGIVAIQFSDLSSAARKSLTNYLVQMKMVENRQRLNDGLKSAAQGSRGAPAPVRSLPVGAAGRPAKLGETLVRNGLINGEQLTIATGHQREHGGLLALILVSLGAISEDDLVKCLNREYRLPTIDLASADPTTEVLQLVPLAIARQHAILPVGLSGSTLTVAIGDPSNVDGLAAVKFRSGCELRVTLAPVRSLLHAIDHFYAERARETG